MPVKNKRGTRKVQARPSPGSKPKQQAKQNKTKQAPAVNAAYLKKTVAAPQAAPLAKSHDSPHPSASHPHHNDDKQGNICEHIEPEIIRRLESRGKKVDIPRSIWILIYYSLIIALGYIGLSYFTEFSLVLGYLFTGIFAKVINLLFALLICGMAYGFYYRKRFAYNLSIFVYLLSIVSPIISIIFEKISETEQIYSFKSKLVYFFLLSIALNGLTLWFIYKKKDFFFKKDYDMKKTYMEDKVLRASISGIAVVCVLILLFGGIYMFSSVTPKVDSINTDIEGMGIVDSISYCFQDSSVDDEDLCLLVVASKNRNSKMASTICSEISQEADFYKVVCSMVVKE